MGSNEPLTITLIGMHINLHFRSLAIFTITRHVAPGRLLSFQDLLVHANFGHEVNLHGRVSITVIK